MPSYDGTPRPGTDTYRSRPCKRCGNTLRYRTNRVCVSCTHKTTRERSAAHTPQNARWLTYTALGRTNKLLNSCRQREARRGVPLAQRLEVRDWVGPVYYEICWGSFAPLFKAQIENGKRNKRAHPWSPSIDRIDRSIPTYANNFRVVPWRINQVAHHVARNGWPYDVQDFLDRTGVELPTEPLRLA
ncbi:MAG: hypothetical protein GY906_23050 [bacterium]|nr:hypothetical protein [bacterium]